MRVEPNAAKDFHCPRWNELADIPLYMDQILFVLEKALGPFFADEGIITPTMINNYVKQKVIAPPEKKRYGRKHIGELAVVSVMKRIFSMNEIVILKETLLGQEDIEAGYNLFCKKLEQALVAVFVNHEPMGFCALPECEPPTILDAAMAGLAGKLYVQSYVEERIKQQEDKHADKKKESSK